MSLSLAELPREELHAGDVIEYLPGQFVAGDPRGRRRAVVLRVNSASQLPIAIDTGEAVSLTTLVRRVQDRHGQVVRGLWRKLRTLVLIKGCTSPRVRRPTLSFILSEATTAAFAATARARKRGECGGSSPSSKRVKLHSPSHDDDHHTP